MPRRKAREEEMRPGAEKREAEGRRNAESARRMTATKRRAEVPRPAKRGREKRGPDGRAKRRAERREVNDCGQRSGAARRKGGEVRNQRFANPSLPRLWRGPARHARVTARPAKRSREKRRPDGHAKRRAERREANDCGQRSEAARRKDAKLELAQLQILPCRPQRGRPSAPRARRKRQTVRRALPTFGTAANPAAQDAF